MGQTPSNVSYESQRQRQYRQICNWFLGYRHIIFHNDVAGNGGAAGADTERAVSDGRGVRHDRRRDPPLLDNPSDNSAKVCPWCASQSPLQSSELSAFTLYPCVGITTGPCDSNDDVRVRATVPDQDGYILDSGTAVFHVQDHPLARAFDSHAGSVNSGDRRFLANLM